MTKKLFILLLIAASSILQAQKISKKALTQIKNVEDARAFIEENESRKNKIVIFNEAKHRTPLAKELLELSEGDVKMIEKEYNTIYYKILEKKEIMSYRVSHITLDGEGVGDYKMRLSMDKIIQEYDNGMPFDLLVRKYSIDEDNVNYGGDTGWFSETEDNTELEKAIINDNGSYGKNEIFILSPPDTELYYIAVKAYDPKEVSEITVLKIVEPI